MQNRLPLIFIFLLQSLLPFAQRPALVFNIPIFAYHRFGDGRYPATNISLEVFGQQLQYLKDNNYTVLTFGDAVEKWKNAESFPEKAVILTVDDGYLSFYSRALPLLKRYGYPATVFIQTGTIGGSDFMNWEQLIEIKKAGMEIGNHSDAHTFFVNLPEAERSKRFKADFETASSAFDKHLGIPPTIYAYTYGEWTKDMENVLEQNGIIAAAVQKSGVFCESSNPFAIPRFPMGGPFGTLQGFKNKINMKALRVEEIIPESPFFSENPPKLTLKITPGKINTSQLQFFVDGEKMEDIAVRTEGEFSLIEIVSSKKLTDRRTLYTITAPSIDGKSWHWFSHLLIRPEVGEE